VLRGGTHVSRAPSVHYLSEVFLPTIQRLGVRADVDLVRWGFYPIGKGEVVARITPCPELKGLTWDKPGPVTRVSGISAVANLPRAIAERQKDAASHVLKAAGVTCDIRLVEAPAVAAAPCFLKAEMYDGAAGSARSGRSASAPRSGREAAEECLVFLKTRPRSTATLPINSCPTWLWPTEPRQ
jgi:RNA 3'-terminal phosphate cyclase (ATP)